MRPIYPIQSTVPAPTTASNPTEVSPGKCPTVLNTQSIQRKNSREVYKRIGQFQCRPSAESAVSKKVKQFEEQISSKSSKGNFESANHTHSSL